MSGLHRACDMPQHSQALIVGEIVEEEMGVVYSSS